MPESLPVSAPDPTPSSSLSFKLPKKIPEELARSVFQAWRGGGVALTTLFPDRRDYLRIRLEMMDLGLFGNRLRADRLAQQRDRERQRAKMKKLERDAQRAQKLTHALTILEQYGPTTCQLMICQTRASSGDNTPAAS